SIRLYELLIQYWRLGERRFEVEELRKILGITDSEYPLYANFKQRVILTAQAELAKSTDLSFTFKEIKTGRKVTGIEFTITVKAPEPTEAKTTTPTKAPKATPTPPTQQIDLPTTAPEVEPPDIPQPDLTALVNMLPPEHQGKQTIITALTAAYKAHGKAYVAYNIKYTNANCKDKGKYRVYLNKALKENWGEALKEDVEASKKQAIAKQEAKKKEDTVRHDKELYDRAIEYIGKLKAKERKKLEAEAMATLPIEQQEKVKADNFYALKGLKWAMEGIVMER
ncbi:MAG: RepB family plasmid replication initiator protein, partial [Nitrospirae bacterium]|nr:RepB family plasmid replication initiator protein [Nitrospirota bacterium]